MTQWYEALFTNYAEKYEEESFTKGTLKEVDFIENEIKYNKKCRILDVEVRPTFNRTRQKGLCSNRIDLSKICLKSKDPKLGKQE